MAMRGPASSAQYQTTRSKRWIMPFQAPDFLLVVAYAPCAIIPLLARERRQLDR